MSRSWQWAVVGVAAAIAITSTMDATGASAFSALPLFPLLALLWYAQRFTAKDVGFAWGKAPLRSYGLAVLYPVAVMGAIAAVAAVTGALDPGAVPHKHNVWLNLLVNIVGTIVVGLLTEEGFFRGWLWASLGRARQRTLAILASTSVAFALWHWSSAVLPTGFNPPPAQVPTFLINAAIIGLVWGMLRLLSGSVVVTSVSHGVWNGLAYVLFGYGSHAGALGIANTALYGPEVGILGLLLNVAFAAALFAWCMRKQMFA